MAGRDLDLDKNLQDSPDLQGIFSSQSLLPFHSPVVLGFVPCRAGAVKASHVPVVHVPSDASLSAALLSSTVLFLFSLCV